ncbi:MAG: GtrA family protein [Anaerolineae bacterium]|nr:GtrA family protein [Anaerolineae bacterium]
MERSSLLHLRARAAAFPGYREIGRFLKFSVVGALGAVIDFGLLNLLIQLAGFPKVIANACSFTTAVISNFTWNRLWVYPETRGEPLRKQFVQFFIVNLAGLFINTAIFYTADRYLLGESGLLAGQVAALAGAIGMTHFDLAYNGAKVIATGIVLFWNFFVNRLWTFRHVR